MKSLFKWITTIFVTAILIVFAYSSINGVLAQTTSPNLETTSPSPNLYLSQNSTPSDDSATNVEQKNFELKSNFRVLAGGAVRTIEIPLKDPETTVYQAELIDAKGSTPLKVLQSIPSIETKTIEVILEIPDIHKWLWFQKRLVLHTSVKIANKTDESLSILTSQFFWVSPRITPRILTLPIILVFYLLAVLGGTNLNTNYKFCKLFWNPVALTSGPFGQASLSMFQIFGFTLVILGIISYIYLRNGVLTPLSNDILLLLGISGGGAVAGKVVRDAKKRLSFENWAWLRRYQWLTIGEKGYDKEPKIEDAKWRDLLKSSDHFFNVYSFQLAGFSFIVAIYLIVGIIFEFGASKIDLGSFTLPESFLAVLGFSNAVYILGRAADPNSCEELDQKITALRELADLVTPKNGNSLDKKSQEYQKYIDRAVLVAKMLQSLYGKEGTFDGKGFRDSDLEKPLIAPYDVFISSPENQRRG